MLNYHNDRNFKIEYNPQNNKTSFYRQWVGAQDYIEITLASFVYSDSNSIFVSDTSGDDTSGDGTQSNPYKTILKGCNSCTSSKIYVVVIDSVLYSEDLSTLNNNYFTGLYCAGGSTSSSGSSGATYAYPRLSLRTLDYTPSDSNTIYVSKAGNDTNSGTSAAPKLTLAGASAACTAAKQSILIADSGTYTEAGFEFTGNIKNLRAALGQKPTVSLSFNKDFFTADQEETATQIIADGPFYKNAGCCHLSDGKIIIAFTATGPNADFIVYNSDYTLYSAYSIVQSNAHGTDCEALSNDNILFVYADNADSLKGKFQIIDYDGNVIKTATTFTTRTVSAASYLNGPRVTVLKEFGPDGQDYALFTYVDTSDNKGRFMVMDMSDYSTVQAESVFNDAGTEGQGCCVSTDNNYVAITYEQTSDSTGKYLVLDTSDWSESVSETQFSTGVMLTDCCYLKNGLLCIHYADNPNTGSQGTDFLIINPLTDTTIKSATSIEAHESHVGVTTLLNGDIYFLYGDWAGIGDIDGLYYQTYRPDQYLLKVSTDAIFNGIVFNASSKEYMSKYINGNSADIDISHCTFDEIESDTTNQEAWCIYSNHEVNADHCSMHDGQKGVYTESNTSIIEDNQFYRLDKGYSVHVKGTASILGDITIEHNTFFNNYAALRLENNGGTYEVVKNNIFHDNNVYDINADTSQSFTNSTYTGTLNNASAGASVIKANPLFINEGALDEDDTDLQLKLRVFGYPADSPAYLLGDETSPDRDSGAWDVFPIGAITTWTSITIEKPSTGIKLKYEFIGNIITRKKDGDIETDYDDVMELIEIDFEGIRNSEWDDLMDMLTCGNNEIRLYPDPDTYPDSFNLYKIIYQNVEAGVKQFRLSRTGKQKFLISMARAYE
jgi:hypothetical protein